MGDVLSSDLPTFTATEIKVLRGILRGVVDASYWEDPVIVRFRKLNLVENRESIIHLSAHARAILSPKLLRLVRAPRQMTLLTLGSAIPNRSFGYNRGYNRLAPVASRRERQTPP